MAQKKVLIDYSKYELVHNLAIGYKNGKKENAEKLIDCFNLFLNDYSIFLAYGSYVLGNYSIRRFISLYSRDKVRKNYNQYNYMPYVKQSIHDTVGRITYVLSDYSYQEIYNECACALLEMALIYKDTKPSFHNYVHKCFHYRLKDNLDKITSSSKRTIPFDDSIMLADDRVDYEYEQALEQICKSEKLEKTSFKVEDNYSVLDDRHLNYNWELGATCSDEFKILTPFERNLLIQSYIKKKSDIEISDNYGLARETVNRKKRIAIRKLEKILIENKKLTKR